MPNNSNCYRGGMEIKILVKQPINGQVYYKPVCGGGVVDTTQPTSLTRRGRVQEGGTVCPTIMTANHLCRLEFEEDGGTYYGDVTDERSETSDDLSLDNPYRIRKLTPRECFRLMDFTDADFDKAKAVNSETQLYKQAGNSIVVNVLTAIIGQMIPGKENVYKEIGHEYFKRGINENKGSSR